jgi:hypothetical protein
MEITREQQTMSLGLMPQAVSPRYEAVTVTRFALCAMHVVTAVTAIVQKKQSN